MVVQSSSAIDNDRVTFAVRVPRELMRRLKVHCVTHEMLVQEFVTHAVAEKLKREAEE